MPSGEPVQLADPRADEARPATITMIAIAGSGLGLLFMLGLARVLPSEEAHAVHRVFPQAVEGPATQVAALPPGAGPASEPEPARPDPLERPRPSAPAVPTRLATAGQEPRAGAAGDSTPHQSPAPVAALPSLAAAQTNAAKQDEPRANATVAPAPAEPRAPTGQPARTTGSKRRVKPIFEPGVVAYVRCEGLEQRDARFPCPRDRKLEEHVWLTLAQLVDCTEAELGRGIAELRLALRKSRVHSVDFRSSTTGTSLNLRAVSKCASSKLANARTSLQAPHGVVSFRFGLK